MKVFGYKNFVLVLVAFTAFIVPACKDDDNNQTQEPDNIEFVIPPGFPTPVYQFTNNAVTNERFELGRKLFYDPILSRDNSISCGSCHLQAGAFAHIDHKVSHGIDDLEGIRNAPGLFNLAWHDNFMWDGGINHIEVQPIGPIENPVEMDETLSNVILKLRASTQYKTLFKAAYGSDSITSQMMLRSMAQFMAVMVSADSKYDKYIRGEAGGTFDAQELNGLNLFRQNCASCHTEPLFTDLSFRNNGLDSIFTLDQGRATITLDPNDEGKFKVPSLRNIEVTFPYMHNGKIKTLDKVLDHYTSGVLPSTTLDPLLVGGIALTTQEKADIVKFLRTLTDNTFLTNPRYSEIH
ncbi:MAG: cytochrome-c peroxidase [Bacteroidetes bacterium]|nr:cytochrome-c peroxidase [Bacteroidota bacterium]